MSVRSNRFRSPQMCRRLFKGNRCILSGNPSEIKIIDVTLRCEQRGQTAEPRYCGQIKHSRHGLPTLSSLSAWILLREPSQTGLMPAED